MRRELNLTESQIVAAIEAARSRPVVAGDPPGAMTPDDIAAAIGLSTKTVRHWIKMLKASGTTFNQVEVIRYDIWDRPYRAKALILVDPEQINP